LILIVYKFKHVVIIIDLICWVDETCSMLLKLQVLCFSYKLIV